MKRLDQLTLFKNVNTVRDPEKATRALNEGREVNVERRSCAFESKRSVGRRNVDEGLLVTRVGVSPEVMLLPQQAAPVF
jgi:hypothetical protein